jgi:AraC-like DNA-binding protein
MLRYLGTGIRQFGLFPLTCSHRMDWEFYAVVRGRIALLTPEGGKPQLKQHRMWVLPPQCSHGWTGDGPRKATIAAFHFSTVPPPLDKIAQERHYLYVDLNQAEAYRVMEIAEELGQCYQRPTSLDNLYHQKALLELTLMALKNEPVRVLPPSPDTARAKVEAALIWFAQHIAEQPKLEQVARGVHVSSSHLRRLFHRVRKVSPQTAFTQLRIEQAMELMSRSDDKLKVIADSCGFSSVVNFCRVFKAHTQKTPDFWRKTRLAPYQSPVRPER